MPFDGSNYDSPVTELLERAWRLIDKPHKWCRNAFTSPDGRRHCSLGALETAFFECDACLPDAVAARNLLARAMADSPVRFNDSHSHREVAAAWQCAIALSRSHG